MGAYILWMREPPTTNTHHFFWCSCVIRGLWAHTPHFTELYLLVYYESTQSILQLQIFRWSKSIPPSDRNHNSQPSSSQESPFPKMMDTDNLLLLCQKLGVGLFKLQGSCFHLIWPPHKTPFLVTQIFINNTYSTGQKTMASFFGLNSCNVSIFPQWRVFQGSFYKLLVCKMPPPFLSEEI